MKLSSSSPVIFLIWANRYQSAAMSKIMLGITMFLSFLSYEKHRLKPSLNLINLSDSEILLSKMRGLTSQSFKSPLPCPAEVTLWDKFLKCIVFGPERAVPFLIELILLSHASLALVIYGLLSYVLLSLLSTDPFSLNVFSMATFLSLKVSLMKVV